MESKVVTFEMNDEIRMKRIVLDGDRDDALKFVKDLLKRISASSVKGMKNHLDK